MWQVGFVLDFYLIPWKKSVLNTQNGVGVQTISFVYVDSEPPLTRPSPLGLASGELPAPKALFTIYVDKTDRQHHYKVLCVVRITFFRGN